MPTPQLDDRKAIAELACDHGWTVTEVRQHTSPTAELKANKVLFEVHYVQEDDGAGIVVMYNAIDRMTSAHLQVGDRQDHAYRVATVRNWLASYGKPIERLTYSSTAAKLLRGNEIVAEAVRHESGEWVILLPGNNIGAITIGGLPENLQRRILLAVMQAL